MESRNYELKLLLTNDDWCQSTIMGLSCNLHDNCIIVVYCQQLQGSYRLLLVLLSADLVCRMLHDHGIWCGAQLAPSSEITRWKVSGKEIARQKVSGKDNASDFADDTLEVIQSAGSWVYPGYLPLMIHKGCLGRSLAYVMCCKKILQGLLVITLLM